MLKYLAPLVFAAVHVQAQEMLNMTRHACAPFTEAADLLQQTGQEILFQGYGLGQHLTGEKITANIVFHVNQDTGVWSLVSLHQGGIACLIMAGHDFSPWTGEKFLKKDKNISP